MSPLKKKRKLHHTVNVIPDSDQEEEEQAVDGLGRADGSVPPQNPLAAADPATADAIWTDDQGRTWIADPQAIQDYNAFNDEYYDIVEQLPNEIPRNHALILQADKMQLQSVESLKEAAMELYRSFRSKEDQHIIDGYLASSLEDAKRPVALGPADTAADPAAASTANMGSSAAIQLAPALPHSATSTGTTLASSSIDTSAQAETNVQNAQIQATPFLRTVQPEVPIKLPSDASGITFTPQQRDLLRKIAQLAKTNVRAAREKVTIANTSFAVVQRHIRRLDHDLQATTDALTLGLRPDTQPSHEVQAVNAPTDSARRKERKGLSAADQAILDQADFDMDISPSRRRLSVTLKTGRGRPVKYVGQEIRVGQHRKAAIKEPRFCYCNGIDRGIMVACQNEGAGCPFGGWFHVDCIGYKNAESLPQIWYCDSCNPKKRARAAR